jgi:hypothetical protein
MKSSDYLFCVDYENSDDELAMFCFTSKDYWNKNGHLDDCLDELDLPAGFYNAMEATWEYEGTVEDGMKALLDAGFIYSQEMHDFINVE